jgi:hypothetical protein
VGGRVPLRMPEVLGRRGPPRLRLDLLHLALAGLGRARIRLDSLLNSPLPALLCCRSLLLCGGGGGGGGADKTTATTGNGLVK